MNPAATRMLDQKQWEEELDRDSVSGRLDFLFAEADDEAKSGALREWAC